MQTLEFTRPRHWLYQIPVTVSAWTVSSITAKLGLLQALISQLLPVTKVQAEVIIRTPQRCKASAKKLVPVLVLPPCLLRGHLHKYVILPEAGATLHVPQNTTVLKTRELGHSGNQLLFLPPCFWGRGGNWMGWTKLRYNIFFAGNHRGRQKK